MSSARDTYDQPERRRDKNIPMPLISEYFENNIHKINNKRYANIIKTSENMRVITLNAKGYRMRENKRIKEMRESIEKYQIDIALFN